MGDRLKRTLTAGPSFVGYLTAGDGGADYTVQAAGALIAGGVNVLEIGLPFSDPVADGAVIQQAMSRALDANITPADTLAMGRRIRQNWPDVPLVLFSYYNPILAGGDDFYRQTADAGFDGMLVVDLPPEEASEHVAKARGVGLDTVFLSSPSTANRRLPLIRSQGSGFLYYACRKGTTGIKTGLPEGYEADVDRLRRGTDLPIVAGFGIGDQATAARALQAADGFVVGSAFVRAMADRPSPQQLTDLAQSIDPRAQTPASSS